MIRPQLAIDTAPLISWFERNPRFEPAIAQALGPVMDGEALAVVSTLALLEVLTGAYRRGDEALARRYQDLFSSTEGIAVLPVDAVIATEAARLRVRHRLSTADAIHLATALVAGAPVFLTTDRRLARVKEIDVRVLRPSPPKRMKR